MNSIDHYLQFKSELGQFLIEFARLEHTLAFYCSIIDSPRKPNLYKFLGDDFHRKRNFISDHFKTHLPELLQEWRTINSEIGNINEDRRHLIHGIGQSYFFKESISTFVKKGDRIVEKLFTSKEIRNLTNRIGHLLTGTKGIKGHFQTKFLKAVFDFHNHSVPNKEKIVFESDGKIITEWKG